MARGHGRILTSIWEDTDFTELDESEQRLYLFLISQPNLNHAGLLDLTLRRWSRKARGLSVGELEKRIHALEQARFIVVDDDTEELLIRSFIRNDGVWKQPKVMGAAVSGALEISSKRLQQALLAEMDRIPLDELSDEPTKVRAGGEGPSIRRQVQNHIEDLRRAFGTPTPDPTGRGSVTPSAPPSGTPSDTPAEGGPKGSTRGRAPASRAHSPAPAPTPTTNPVEDVWAEEPSETEPTEGPEVSDAAEPVGATITQIRPDVEQACSLLAELMEANGCRRPTVTKEWRDAARLLIDKDGVPLDHVLGAIRWSQANDFWMANIQSMPKLRKQYDTLRLQAQRGRVQPAAPTAPSSMTDEEKKRALRF
ncbi:MULTISPECIES: hypothetical protein [Streptomyces]|uniref:hypothetical protein n=1 Tax=Streptomyces TaxID=1883 RepID=UPI00168B43E0|nr:hypothetical protein [Streptomyces sp. JV180]MBD3549824.1 hypothetical protein [Streptomyces sp. JV180]